MSFLGGKEAELQPGFSPDRNRELEPVCDNVSLSKDEWRTKKGTEGFLSLLLIGSGHCCNQAPPSIGDKTTSSSTVSHVDADLVTAQRKPRENMLAG